MGKTVLSLLSGDIGQVYSTNLVFVLGRWCSGVCGSYAVGATVTMLADPYWRSLLQSSVRGISPTDRVMGVGFGLPKLSSLDIYLFQYLHAQKALKKACPVSSCTCSISCNTHR
jgi:hypothetical protein